MITSIVVSFRGLCGLMVENRADENMGNEVATWLIEGDIGRMTNTMVQDSLCTHTVDGGNLAPLRTAKLQ